MFKHLLIVLFILLPGSVFADWASDRDGSAGYVEITVLASAIDEPVPFFIVYGSTLDGTVHTAMDAAGDTTGETIRASNADGSTPVACWPVEGDFDTTTNTWAVAVRGTGMSASVNTTYRLYFGNPALSMPAVTDTYGRNAVFAGFTAVFFPGAGNTDVTGNGYTLSGTVSTTDSGYEGMSAAVFNGTSDVLTYSGTVSGFWPITSEALVYTTSNAAAQTAVGLGSSTTGVGANIALLRLRGDVNDRVTFAVDGTSGSTATATTSTAYSINTWHYVMGVHDTDNDETLAYINGGSVGTSGTVVAGPSFNRISLGAAVYNTTANYLAGRITYAAIDNEVKSANYSTTMKNVWDGTTYTDGAWVDLGGGGGLTIKDTTNGFMSLVGG